MTDLKRSIATALGEKGGASDEENDDDGSPHLFHISLPGGGTFLIFDCILFSDL